MIEADTNLRWGIKEGVENYIWEGREEVRWYLKELMMLVLRHGCSVGVPQDAKVDKGLSLRWEIIVVKVHLCEAAVNIS